MEIILYFFRDTISGVHYFIYAFVCLFLMFSIIGYLFKQKYAKLEIKLKSSQPSVQATTEQIATVQGKAKKLSRKEKKLLKQKNNIPSQSPNTPPVQTKVEAPIPNQVASPPVTPQVTVQNTGQSVVSNQPNQQVVKQANQPLNVVANQISTSSQTLNQGTNLPNNQTVTKNIQPTNTNTPIPEIK